MKRVIHFTRRRGLLGAGMFMLVGAHVAVDVLAHETFGPVRPPLPAPAMKLTATHGKAFELSRALHNRVTAVQLMFTGCSATCPIQGAVFADVQQRLDGEALDFRLLSISIDPLGDDLDAMRAWLAKFGAQPYRWSGALPSPADVDRLLDFMRGRASGADRHTPQTYIFDRRARLAFRSADLPSGEQLVSLMKQVASLA